MKKYTIFVLIFGITACLLIFVIFFPSKLNAIGSVFNKIFHKRIAGAEISSSIDSKISVKLGNLGEKMVKEGVIDKDKIDALYAKRGQKDEMDRLLSQKISSIEITKDNADLFLNFFWALGLSNKNPILDQGPMVQNGPTANFASTGGWTLSRGQTMEHYSKHEFIVLNPNQQKMVSEISKNIYRPCCGNSTYFPDCNHGMAMLGFLELMASQGFSEKEIYKNALTLNSFWFSDNYLVIAQYLVENGQAWAKVDPKIILGKGYSSSQGFANIRSKVKNLPKSTENGGCSI